MEKPLEMTIRNEAFYSKATILRCGRLLRSVPNRRTVYEGLCNEQPAVIKLFLSAIHGKRHFKREFQGFDQLSARGLKTAKILAFGRNGDGQHVLVLEKIENAPDLFTLVESSKELKGAKRALKAAFVYIADMHAAGILQQDLHLGNFLWDGTSVFALDPAEMTFAQGPAGKTDSFQQLAVLFASLPDAVWAEKENLLKSYFQTRKWKLTDADVDRIETLTARTRMQYMNRMLRKTLRTSKRYTRHKQDNRTGVFARDVFEKQDPNAFLFNIDNLMENGEILKRGNTCFVSKIRLGNFDIVIKRYNHKGLLHSFRHTLKRSRARRCWLFGHRLRALGISCARPIAFIEQRQHGLIWQSYIVNEFLDGAELCDVIDSQKLTQSRKDDAIAQSEQLLEQLSQAQMTHGDMKPGNIMICEGEPKLIDLDSMKQHRFSPMLAFYKNRMMSSFHNRLHQRSRIDLPDHGS